MWDIFTGLTSLLFWEEKPQSPRSDFVMSLGGGGGGDIFRLGSLRAGPGGDLKLKISF